MLRMTMDIIVSNCVICLCPDKKTVVREAYKVLKVREWAVPSVGETSSYWSRRWASALLTSSQPVTSRSTTASSKRKQATSEDRHIGEATACILIQFRGAY